MIFQKRLESFEHKYKIKKIMTTFSFSEETATLLFLRGLNTEEKIKEFITPNINRLNNPFLFKDMNTVVNKINYAVKEKQSIVIFGDYDVDGMGSSSILYLYLKSLGANVNVFLPNRYIDEYGLTIGAIDKVIKEYNPQLIITVDCGITAVKEVEYIKSLNIDVIVTDHHEVPEVRPNCPIINPKRKDDTYPFNELCGSGVSLKVVEALGGTKAVEEYLDIAALATIADIVSLTEENRTIVQLGLQKLKTKTREGLKFLFRELKLQESELNSIDIAFKVAPKINASGRMGKAEIGFLLFVEKDKKKLANIVKELLTLNTLRQDLCQKIYEDSILQLSQENVTNLQVIVLKSENWDAGLLGIVAARLVEEFNKPTILFSDKDGLLKGSARSIDNIDIHSIIGCLDVPLEAFGGHTMAAGLTLKSEYFNTFKTNIECCANKLLVNKNNQPVKYYDLELKVKDAVLDFVKELNILAPFGHENPLPLFLLSFQNAKIFAMKNFSEHLTLHFHKLFHIIHFSGNQYLLNYTYFKNKKALIEMQLNSFKGKESVRAIVKAIQFQKPQLKEISQFVKGNYLLQLKYNTEEVILNHKTYEKQNLDSLLQNILKENGLGVLVVCNDVKTYENYVSLFEKERLETHLFTVNDKMGTNAVVLGLNGFENINQYKHIIFTEPILSKSYLTKLQQNTMANIYTQNIMFYNQNFHISVSREVFGEYFNVIRQAVKQKVVVNNKYFYFNELKKLNKQITNFNYVQFIACLEVFCELKLIEEVNTPYEYYLKLNKGVTSNLENANFYQKLNKKGK